MEEQTQLFYEDTTQSVKALRAFSIIFCAISVILFILILVLRLVGFTAGLSQYSRGEDIVITIGCLGFAIYFIIITCRAKKFKYLLITESKIILSYDQELHEFDSADLVSYSCSRVNLTTTKFKVLIGDKKLSINTLKSKELKKVLDKLLKKI